MQELALIGQFSIEAFKENFLYTPITVEEFVMKYHRLGQLLVPRLVLLAVDKKDTLLGFILGIPDMFSEDRTGLIVKSPARRSSDHQIDQPARHDDDLAHRRALRQLDEYLA